MPSSTPNGPDRESLTLPLDGRAASRIIGEGEMAGLIRGFDWNKSPLGPVATWSDTLVTTVNLLLGSRHPMFLWWGSELIQFYNDGYRPSIRDDKHPSAIGQGGRACWPEIWPIIGPQIEAVMIQGKSTWNLNQLVPINRHGKLEEVYWTYSYSPVRDKDGAVQGALVVCSETTDQVLSERRLRTLLAITGDSPAQDPGEGTQPYLGLAESIVKTLCQEPADIPFAQLYLLSHGDVLVAKCGSPDPGLSSAEHWPLERALSSQMPVTIGDLRERFPELVCAPWPEPVTQSYALPLPMAGAAIQCVLIFGISPRLPFDASYRTFFHLVGTRTAALLQSRIQERELAQAAKRFSGLAEANPFGTVIGSLRGELTYVNPSFLKTLGYSADEVNTGLVRWDKLTPPEYAEADAQALRQLRESGRCDVYEKAYIAKDGRRIPILLGASVIHSVAGGAARKEPDVAAFVTDLTPLKSAQEALRRANEELEKKVAERTAALENEVVDRKRAEADLRELTGRLLVAQDEERRHMARELHDHAGQTLAILTMNLSALCRMAQAQGKTQDKIQDKGQKTSHDPKIGQLAADTRELSENLSREIRTLSYLLHPPLLDEVGLGSALQWYVEGFAKRSEIKVDLELPADLGRLPREIELVIFRVVQESLTNIHRHSGSSWARILLHFSEGEVIVEISDRGKGISRERQREMSTAKTGVGVRGMEERVRQFGGKLEISSNHQGTKVAVRLPVSPEHR